MITLASQEAFGPTDAWSVHAYEFPRDGTPSQRLLFALGYATLAPSTHNTQPWRFHLRDGVVELYADRTRAMPALDPVGRELLISCGAALSHLRVALRHFGSEAPVELLPDPATPELLARVSLGQPHRPSLAEDELFHAIIIRRTYRAPFEPIAVPDDLLMVVRREAACEGVGVEVVAHGEARAAVADLIGQADRFLFANKCIRDEIASWTRDNWSAARDGIPGYALGHSEPLAVVAPLIIRQVDIGPVQAFRDCALAREAPVVITLSTPADTAADWLAAGVALSRVLLRACAAGVYASFLNQPIQVPDLRARLRAMLGTQQIPQVMLRMGYANEGRPTPRRRVDAVAQIAAAPGSEAEEH